MVSLEVADLERRGKDLKRSIDICLSELLLKNEDPFALASYYWCLCRHQIQLVNSSWLQQWADAWVSKILIDGQVGIRFDEEMAAASLIVSARRSCTDGKSDQLQIIQKSLLKVLSDSRNHHQIPLGNQAYSSCLLLAISELSETTRSSIIIDALDSTQTAFEASMPNGRMVGLVYLASASALVGESSLGLPWAELVEAWKSNFSSYESRVYILQACMSQVDSTSLEIDIIGDFLDSLPIWPYLMVGIEEVEPLGEGDSGVVLSHLFRAALLDVLIMFEARVQETLRAERNSKKRAKVLSTCATAVGVSVLLCVPWIILARIIEPELESGRLYWMQGEYSAMGDWDALLFMALWILVVFLAASEWFWISNMRSVVAKTSSVNDKQILEATKSSARQAFVATIAVIVVVLPSFFAAEFKHALSGLLS